MAKQRTHSIEFKRQVVQDYLGVETLTRRGVCWPSAASGFLGPIKQPARLTVQRSPDPDCRMVEVERRKRSGIRFLHLHLRDLAIVL
jgi:hypothetical protein